jgi:hypothetical protein
MRSSQIFFSIKGGAITERHRSSIVKLPLPPCPTYSNKFLMDSASPILFFPLDYYFFLSISKSNEMQTTSREKWVV